MTIPSDEEIREAVKHIEDNLKYLEGDGYEPYYKTLVSLAQAYLSAGKGMPEEVQRDNYLHYPSCKGKTVRDCTCGASSHNDVWNECCDLWEESLRLCKLSFLKQCQECKEGKK